MNDHPVPVIPIEACDPEIDDDLRRRITEGIARRQQAVVARGLDFEVLAYGRAVFSAPAEPSLEELRLYQDKIRVHLAISPRPYTRFGILTSVLTKVRQELHALAAFYCNLLGQRQILFNERLVQLLTAFSHRLQSTQRMADQLDTLQRRVEALESRLGERPHEH